MEDLRHVLMVYRAWVASCFETICPWSHCAVQVSLMAVVQEKSSTIPPCRLLFPGIVPSEFWAFSLSPHLRIFDFWALGGPYKFPCTSLTTLSFIDIPWIDWISQILRRIFPRTPRLCDTRLMGLAFAGIIGFGFAIGEPSLEVASCPLFDMALCFPIGSERKLLKWLQENIEKLMILNKRRRWLHSSRVKLSLVRMSASWFLVSTYLIWIFGSKLILSNNQSSATLWVLDTCLIVGLRPLIIILMTASFSSKMYNWDSPWEECVLVGT